MPCFKPFLETPQVPKTTTQRQQDVAARREALAKKTLLAQKDVRDQKERKQAAKREGLDREKAAKQEAAKNTRSLAKGEAAPTPSVTEQPSPQACSVLTDLVAVAFWFLEARIVLPKACTYGVIGMNSTWKHNIAYEPFITGCR